MKRSQRQLKCSRKFLGVFSAGRRATARELPHSLEATQEMPGRILHLLCTLCENYGLYEKCHQIPLGMRSLSCRTGLYSADLKVLSASEHCKTWVLVWRSTIQHKRAADVVIASRNFGEKRVVWS